MSIMGILKDGRKENIINNDIILQMNYPIKTNELPMNIEFYDEAIELYKEAKNYLIGFKWCKQIFESSLVTNIGRALCIYLFKIENTSSKEDNLIWIIVGDFPSMYVDTYGAKTNIEALETYIELAEEWIDTVRKENSTKECYPFIANQDVETALLFEKKITFLKKNLLNHIEEFSVDKIW